MKKQPLRPVEELETGKIVSMPEAGLVMVPYDLFMKMQAVVFAAKDPLKRDLKGVLDELAVDL